MDTSANNNGINSIVTKSVVPRALINAVGMTDFVTWDFNPGKSQRNRARLCKNQPIMQTIPETYGRK